MLADNVAQMLTFSEEKVVVAQGYQRIAGIDEVGRGCLAGPLVAAAVIMPINRKPRWYTKVNDSKLLTAKQRDLLYHCIQEIALGIGVGIVSHEVIDAQGMTKATRMAMSQAVSQISPLPDYLLIDYFVLPGLPLPQKGIKDGDSLCFSIACASIVAKVTRDRMMDELDKTYPGYGLAQHKGYGTKGHIACLRKLGPCPIHRRSFQPVQEIMGRISNQNEV